MLAKAGGSSRWWGTTPKPSRVVQGKPDPLIAIGPRRKASLKKHLGSVKCLTGNSLILTPVTITEGHVTETERRSGRDDSARNVQMLRQQSMVYRIVDSSFPSPLVLQVYKRILSPVFRASLGLYTNHGFQRQQGSRTTSVWQSTPLLTVWCLPTVQVVIGIPRCKLRMNLTQALDDPELVLRSRGGKSGYSLRDDLRASFSTISTDDELFFCPNTANVPSI
ncbi:hypothetical protein L210DRAFT_3503558 [Boletus edulis BED1]|uniref:Uncharacterized protein n=1 Tax=Boletus edulis BED1 TaxID=1328754 RepID=A0AAD4GFY0_BOLED|nr:hypothetical protein L210DRAFT_3503558 [Boletus edulis BED1]